MIFQAIILGLVQGLSEFLPISSSAHLIIVPYLFGWQDPGLGFDIALHWGTLLAVVALFWRDYWKFIKAFIGTFSSSGSWQKVEQRLAWYLILASIPGAIFGFLLESKAETTFRNPLIMVFTLAGFGLVLWWVDGKASQQGKLDKLEAPQAFGIGLAQALALIPGVSRSGATMTAGLLAGLDRESAARFSFLLSGPIIFGAGLVAFKHFGGFTPELAGGFVAAAVSGALAIRFLLQYLGRHNFNLFVWYRLALAALLLSVILARA